MYIIALSVIVGAIGLYYSFLKNLNYFKKRGIPYKSPMPIVGNLGPTLFRLQSLAELCNETYNLHPEAKYVGLFDTMNAPAIMIRDPKLIKSIAIKHCDMFPDHNTLVTEDQDPLFGRNLLFFQGKKWQRVRSLLSPAFTASKIKNMFELMLDCGVDYANYLAQLPPEQRIIQTKDVFARYTNDVIATCAFGVSVDSIKNPENQFYIYGKEAATFGIISFIKVYIFRCLPWLAQLINLKFIHQKGADFFRNLIKNVIKIRDEKGIVHPDMLQFMMENRRNEHNIEMATDDMVGHGFLFFFAGFQTTSTILAFAAHEIAVNQDVQEKLQKDIDKVLEDTNGQAPYEAINGMKYLDAVINETLRMYPNMVLTDRECAQDFELPPTLPGTKPFTLKKGQRVLIPIYGLHHDRKYFRDPEKFDPERFFGEQKKDSFKCGAFLPFGIGPRICLGQKFARLTIKILLFHLLARCNLKSCEKTPIPLKIAKEGFKMTAEGGFWLKVLPRKKYSPHSYQQHTKCKLETMELK